MNAIKLFECTECDIEFKSSKVDGWLPKCPKCNCDYRVFEVGKEGEE